MKKTLLLLTALFAFNFTPAYADHVDGVAHDVTISVNGMVCDFCAQSVKKVFGKQDAVNAISVDLDSGSIIVDLKDGKTLDDSVIEQLITDAGYSITNISRDVK